MLTVKQKEMLVRLKAEEFARPYSQRNAWMWADGSMVNDRVLCRLWRAGLVKHNGVRLFLTDLGEKEARG